MAIYRLPNLMRALLVIGLFATLLGACAPQERQEINFVFMRTSDQTEPYWQEVIRAFEAENPNIKVNLFIFTWDEGRQKIQEMIDQGNPPTLARVATRWIPEYVAAGLLEPVDHYMTPDFRAQFIPLLINEGSQYEGRTFGLPITVSSRAFYYNKDLFEQAGIASPPTNWDELYEAAQAIHKLGPDTYGFGVQGKDLETSTYFYYFLWGNGGEILTEDGTRPAFNGAAGQEAIEFITRMINEGLTQPNPTLSSRADLETAFVEGRLGMVITGPWLARRLANEAPALEYGLSTIPYQTTPTTLAAQDTLILFKQAQNKDAAWKFIEFLYADEYRLKYALTEGVLPEKVSVAENGQFKENQAFAFFMEKLPTGRFEPLNVRSGDIASVMAEALQAAYRGEMTPEAALNEAAIQVQRILSYSATSW
ncbi:MAG: sugar ABC transporter substrate-binding protein [Chloroflexi bacterium]|nr:sugar ABC transporter substrate-binding protein [Chloroflexota bacterium]MDL1943026.1 sugar ABC transporter substrate-binding protein [Chloroflexi bacterium CFX2]